MKTVKEVSRKSGVSVRTLHHYDAIGLLKPTRVTEAGYRLYDDTALGRLQTILLFRQLQFPLKEIMGKQIITFIPSVGYQQHILKCRAVDHFTKRSMFIFFPFTQ